MKSNKQKILMSLLAVGMLFSLTTANAITANELEEENNEIHEEQETVEEEIIDETEIQEEIVIDVNNEVTEEETAPEEVVTTSQTLDVNPTSGIVATSASLEADVTTLAQAFPDANFRTFVGKTVLGNASYDDSTDSGNKLTTADITKITARTGVSISNLNIESLDGIKYFTSLTSLSCGGNLLTELDVSMLTNLKTINCSSNQLVSLNVSNLTNLTSLNCIKNQLVELDVSTLINLKTLTCTTNQLTSLDVSNLINLETLTCTGNQISALDITALNDLTTLTCNSNKIKELDLSNSINLTTLICSSNLIEELDVSALANLTYLNCNINQLSTLDVSNLINLETLHCGTNNLTSLDLTNLGNLKVLGCGKNNLTELDVTNLTDLTQINFQSNKITSIDLSNNHKLTSIQCYINPISKIVISEAAKPNITTFNYRSTNIESIDLTNFTSLTGTLAMTKSTNANLSQLGALYVTGSRPYTDTSMVRVLADVGSISWDAGTGYYVIPANCNATYGFSVTSPSSNGFSSQENVDSLPNGGLMDDEGNLIPGATLADVLSDGTIKVPAGGTIATPNGTYTFDGEATIKDGVITTKDSYMFEKNISVYDEATDSYVADISAIKTVVDVKDGTSSSIDSITGEMDVTAGSVVTNNNGDKTYLTDKGTVDTDGNVISDGTMISVPADKTGEVTTDGNGNTVLPGGSIVSDNGEEVAYPGTIVIDKDDNSITYLPVDSLLNEDGTNLASGIDQKAIDDAQAIVDQMTDSNLKTELQDKINTAQDMLDAKNAVDDLFNDKKDNLAEDVTQKDIDDAKDLVNKLPDGELKEELQKELDKAQDMLNAKNAVEDLLDKDGNLNTGVTQEDIDNAQDLVNKLPDGELKDQLQTIIDDAQKQLDEKNNPIVNPSTKPTTSVPVQKPSVAGSSTTGNNVDTSDTTNLSLYLGMLVVSLSGLVIVLKRNKAKN
ncbi:toxin Cry1Ac domain D-VI-related protein [Breznakia pachnodae]|uniref:Leucine-rich repeat (LRR) protein n=1 Tax=Breznakia pachnodae TaxID=265178 RepID=A0ABU0E203_9FIRM|nr:toxin Cry1Ac domain D-VI-related protein [Breznakia pachnodae]MDQ0360932.1 Leucine-rich repeat (LRR) protein [Breznakia pachnodae]